MSTENTTVFQEDVTANVDVVLQDKLAKANVTEHTLTQLKEELSALNIPVTDKASLALVQGGITKAVNIRNLIVRLCKKGREAAIMEQKAWIGKEKELVALVAAVEGPLVDRKQAYLEEQARIEREQMEAREQAITARFVAIEALGFTRKTTLDGTDTYELEGTTLLVTDISMSEGERWANLLRSAQVVSEEMTARKEAERVAAEQAAALVAQEAERIRLAQEAIEFQQRELKEKQDAFNKQINEARKNELLALGCKTWFTDEGEGTIEDEWVGVRADGKPPMLNTDATALHAMPDDQFARLKVDCAAAIEYLSKKEMEEKAAAARERLIAERVKTLKEAGWEDNAPASGVGINFTKYVDGKALVSARILLAATILEMTQEQFLECVEDGQAELARRKKVDDDRIATAAVEAERRRHEEEAKRKEAEEKERLAKLSDVERWDEWMKTIEQHAPNLASAQGQHAVKHLLAYIKDKYAPSVRNELKK